MTLRRITLLTLAIAVAGASVAIPAAAGSDGPVATAAKKCKKKKAAAAKKKRCKRGGAGAGDTTLPGRPSNPTVNPSAGSSGGGGGPVPTPNVGDLSVANSPVLGGTGTTAFVTLSSAAPSGGQVVTLQSDTPSRVSVPSSVQVAEGQTLGTFPVSTTAGPDVNALLTATIGSSSASAALEVVEEPGVETVTLAYQCFPGVGLVNVGGNRVTLDVPTPSDLPVNLVSSDQTKLTVQPTVTVPGGSNSAFFNVSTVAATPSVTVTGSTASSTANDSASVRDGSSPAPVITGMSLSPSAVTAGNPSTGTVTLNCEALAGGSTVALSSDNADVTVPANVVVLQDKLTANFTINTLATANGVALISGTLGGTQSATLTVDNLGT